MTDNSVFSQQSMVLVFGLNLNWFLLTCCALLSQPLTLLLTSETETWLGDAL